MARRAEPTIEECDRYIRAKEAMEAREREKYPLPPDAPGAVEVVPFGHLRVPQELEGPRPLDGSLVQAAGFNKGFLN